MNYGSRHSVDKHAAGGARSREQKNVRTRSGEAAFAGPPQRTRGPALNGGAPLDPRVRADMEARFGSNFQDVRIHDRNDAHHSAAHLDAKAYTVGDDITFSENRYAPHTAEGKRLIAHELAHVVQQRRGGPSVDGAIGPALEGDAAAAADAIGWMTTTVDMKRNHSVTPKSGARRNAINNARTPARTTRS